MKKAIIVDLDNTLFDSRCMDKYVPGDKTSKEGWDNFHKHYSECKVNHFVYNLIKAYNESYFDKIIFLTSREDSGNVRKVTEEMLKELYFDSYELIMRPEGDYTPCNEMKKLLYEKYIKRKYEVDFAIDDAESILEMWRGLGINTLHCSFGGNE